MGEEREDGAAAEHLGPLFDDSDVEVAVLHRAREVALLERRTHPLVLAGRHATEEDRRLGAAADARAAGAHEHLAVTGASDRLPAQGSDARLVDPERHGLKQRNFPFGEPSCDALRVHEYAP